MMKSIFCAVVGLTCISIPGKAASICVSGTLTAYAAGTGCMIGDKTFSGFAAVLSSIAASGAAAPSSLDNITVVPGGGSANPSFSFQASYLAIGLGASDTLTISYIGVAPANDPFTGASLSLSGTSVSGLGLLTGAEALCQNGGFGDIHVAIPPVCSSGVVVNALLLSQITNANLGATIQFNFAPVVELGILKQITLTGAAGGSAQATALNNGFTATAVPEPGSFVLLGCGLVAFGVRGRFRRGRQT